MEIVIHRINTIKGLREVPQNYGCEIDIRTHGSKFILNHEPLKDGDSYIDYLDEYRHGLLILNIKEAGIEDSVLAETRKRGMTNAFLLDVEFPYLYRAARQGERAISVRYSEDESIDIVRKYKKMVDWVWIDTNTQLPLDKETVNELNGMKTCLVCPERWRRPQDILPYRQKMQLLDFEPTAVMTSMAYVKQWNADIDDRGRM
jgi:hypothetical protein